MLDELLLLSGNDIPFYKANISIHQPRLKEIGYIGVRPREGWCGQDVGLGMCIRLAMENVD